MAKISRIHYLLDFRRRKLEPGVKRQCKIWLAKLSQEVRRGLPKFAKASAKDMTDDLADWGRLENDGINYFKPIILTTTVAGRKTAYGIIGYRGAFDVVPIEAVKLANKICAKLVSNVTDETKAAIRSCISFGLKEGLSTRDIANNLRLIVGLSERQGSAVLNYKGWLQEKHPETDITKLVDEYSSTLFRLRLDTIARTETARALNAGYVATLKEMGEDKFEFSAYEGCCEICEGMNGDIIPIDKADEIIPVHPACRCCLLPIIDEHGIKEPLKSFPEELESPA